MTFWHTFGHLLSRAKSQCFHWRTDFCPFVPRGTHVLMSLGGSYIYIYIKDKRYKSVVFPGKFAQTFVPDKRAFVTDKRPPITEAV